MGKALSTIRNPLRNFNLEGRAHAAVSKSKPTAAPKHKADQLNYEQILHDHPDILEESRKKHQVLDKHLKDVYVISNDAEVIKEQDPNKPLPTDRKPVEDFEYGVKQPKIVPHGRITLKQALEFISQHQNDPVVWTSSKISDDYLLSEEKVKNVLKYFRVYELYVPPTKMNATIGKPSLPKTFGKRVQRPQLPSGKKEDKDNTPNM